MNLPTLSPQKRARLLIADLLFLLVRVVARIHVVDLQWRHSMNLNYCLAAGHGVVVHGTFALTGGRRMYISRGVGHLLQVRFNVRPEIPIFRLQRES